MPEEVKPLIGGQQGLSLVQPEKRVQPPTNPTAFTPQTDFGQSIKLGTKQKGSNKYLDVMQKGLRGINRKRPARPPRQSFGLRNRS